MYIETLLSDRFQPCSQLTQQPIIQILLVIQAILTFILLTPLFLVLKINPTALLGLVI